MDIFAACAGVSTALIKCSDDMSTSDTVFYILNIVINVFSAAVALLAVAGIIYAGIQYMTAGANEQQVVKAKKRIQQVVIGMFVYALAWAGVEFLVPGGILNNGGAETATNSESETAGEAASDTRSSSLPDAKDGSEPDTPERGETPTGDEGWIDRAEE